MKSITLKRDKKCQKPYPWGLSIDIRQYIWSDPPPSPALTWHSFKSWPNSIPVFYVFIILKCLAGSGIKEQSDENNQIIVGLHKPWWASQAEVPES